MLPSLKGILKTLGPRLIGLAASALTGFIYDKTKGAVQLDPEATTILVTGMLGSYAVAHRAASSVINPGDAAKERVADAVKSAADDPRASNTVIVEPSK